MRLTLEALAVLDAIERRGCFAAAAEELHRVPSAITYTVQKLEQDLGVAVFDRSGHRAVLTAAGEKLLADGRHLLRAAGALEGAVRRLATGWETELVIAVDDLLPVGRLFPILERFYAEGHGTQVRLIREVLSGAWDALVSSRAELAVAASGEGPAGGGLITRPLGVIEFAFVIAPDHPLAAAAEPLGEEDLLGHRAVAVADTSRSLPPVTSALLGGQQVLTVPDMAAKVEAHRRGLGVGYVPCYLVAADLAAGRLIRRTVETAIPHPQVSLAWRGGAGGKALRWFTKALQDPSVYDGIVAA